MDRQLHRFRGGRRGHRGELTVIRKHYHELATLAHDETDLTKSHSVEEARSRHSAKLQSRRRA